MCVCMTVRVEGSAPDVPQPGSSGQAPPIFASICSAARNLCDAPGPLLDRPLVPSVALVARPWH